MRWYRRGLIGVSNVLIHITNKNVNQNRPTHYEKYDLVREYRKTIPEDVQPEIYVYKQLHQMEIQRRKIKRSGYFVKPTELP